MICQEINPEISTGAATAADRRHYVAVLLGLLLGGDADGVSPLWIIWDIG